MFVCQVKSKRAREVKVSDVDSTKYFGRQEELAPLVTVMSGIFSPAAVNQTRILCVLCHPRRHRPPSGRVRSHGHDRDFRSEIYEM